MAKERCICDEFGETPCPIHQAEEDCDFCQLGMECDVHAVDVMPTPQNVEYLEDRVTLSNKFCPRWYTNCQPCCAKDRCWYDEQKARRANGLKAIAPKSWDGSLPTKPPEEVTLEKVVMAACGCDCCVREDKWVDGQLYDAHPCERADRFLDALIAHGKDEREEGVGPIRKALSSRGYCGDGGLAGMVGRALDEAEDKGARCAAKPLEEAISGAESVIFIYDNPDDRYCGTLGERMEQCCVGQHEEGVKEQKQRCADADPVHFCNACGSEFLECCHEHMLALKEAE